mmetsp:Transcript_23624/g.48895  ORF Transcript_23624/g.48895 Transcript_23624/m.48895 type:complete len:118 (-) Transcript_23624:196-549(-)
MFGIDTSSCCVGGRMRGGGENVHELVVKGTKEHNMKKGLRREERSGGYHQVAESTRIDGRIVSESERKQQPTGRPTIHTPWLPSNRLGLSATIRYHHDLTRTQRAEKARDTPSNRNS